MARCQDDRRKAAEQKQVTKSEFKAKAFEYFREVEKTGQTIDRGLSTVDVRSYRDERKLLTN